MLPISLIFIGIALVMNGIVLWRKADYVVLTVINLFTGLLLVYFNLYNITVGDPDNMVAYFGGLLFGLTFLVIAFDCMFDGDANWTGWFSMLATLCSLAISIFYFVVGEYAYGALWIVWMFIWLFAFIGFAVFKRFQPITYLMFIAQGALATGLVGMLIIFNAINI